MRLALVLLCAVLPAAEEAGKIMRPPHKSWFTSGSVDVIATAPEGMLELDGSRIAAEQPFPNVLHAKVNAKPGVHTLKLSWAGGQKEIQFSVGAAPGFEQFRAHPPSGEVACTQCHQLSRRGRFMFKGGCFDCHQDTTFAKTHTHKADVLAECGICHNAHGSTVSRHLLHSKEFACKQCHN